MTQSARLPVASPDTGVRSCADPAPRQATGDRLGPADVHAVFARWSHRLPWALTAADRAAGFDPRVPLRRMEVSLTPVCDRPGPGRHFFEAVIREQLALGRPDRGRLRFPMRLPRATPPAPLRLPPRVRTAGVDPTRHLQDTHATLKQSFKEGRALRGELPITTPTDCYVNTGLDPCPTSAHWAPR